MLRLLGFDLDGTALNAQSQLSAHTHSLLAQRGKEGLLRIAITGRSLQTARLVLGDHAPIDYLIFSSGAGIARWDDHALLHAFHMPPASASSIASILTTRNLGFTAHLPIPHNHRFLYRRGGQRMGADFEARLEKYADMATELPHTRYEFPDGLAQFVVTLKPDLAYFDGLASALAPYGDTLRATSPLDHESLWLEIFPHGVSKGAALAWLCARLGVNEEDVAVVGNVYNDLSMLSRFANAYVVANAPEELKAKYPVLPHHDEEPIARLLERMKKPLEPES